MQLKLEADLKQPHPSHLDEVFKCSQICLQFLLLLQFQEACCLAAVDRVAVFANPESLAQVDFWTRMETKRICCSRVREVSARLTSAVKLLDQRLATSGSFSPIP